MTKDETNAYLATVLETLNDTPEGKIPSGLIAAALLASNVSSRDWRALRDILIAGKLVKPEPNHIIAITDRGREMVVAIRAERAKPASHKGVDQYVISVHAQDGFSYTRRVVWKDGKIAGVFHPDGRLDDEDDTEMKRVISTILRAHSREHAGERLEITLTPVEAVQ